MRSNDYLILSATLHGFLGARFETPTSIACHTEIFSVCATLSKNVTVSFIYFGRFWTKNQAQEKIFFVVLFSNFFEKDKWCWC